MLETLLWIGLKDRRLSFSFIRKNPITVLTVYSLATLYFSLTFLLHRQRQETPTTNCHVDLQSQLQIICAVVLAPFFAHRAWKVQAFFAAENPDPHSIRHYLEVNR